MKTARRAGSSKIRMLVSISSRFNSLTLSSFKKHLEVTVAVNTNLSHGSKYCEALDTTLHMILYSLAREIEDNSDQFLTSSVDLAFQPVSAGLGFCRACRSHLGCVAMTTLQTTLDRRQLRQTNKSAAKHPCYKV
jgi:hypothetical protein